MTIRFRFTDINKEAIFYLKEVLDYSEYIFSGISTSFFESSIAALPHCIAIDILWKRKKADLSSPVVSLNYCAKNLPGVEFEELSINPPFLNELLIPVNVPLHHF